MTKSGPASTAAGPLSSFTQLGFVETVAMSLTQAETQDPPRPASEQVVPSSWITTVLVGFTILLFVMLLALAFPPIKTEILASSPQPVESMRRSPDVWADWIPFGVLLTEVVLGLLLGGALIAELVANHVHHRLNDIEKRTTTGTDKLVTNAIQRLRTSFSDVYTAAGRQPGMRAKELMKSSVRAFIEVDSLVRHAPSMLMLVGIAAVLRHFPRGLYGVLTVIAFLLLTACKVADIYLDDVQNISESRHQTTRQQA
jgi:hypothetical protein